MEKKYYCKEKNCENEICYKTWKYGQGRCRSCETKRRWDNGMYAILLEKKPYLSGKNSYFYNKHYKGEKAFAYIDGRTNKKYYCKDCLKKGIKTEVSMCSGFYGDGLCNACAQIKRWQNEKYRNKMLKASMLGRLIVPNKPETLLNNLLNEVLPNEYKFVGDGYTFIAGFCPDFINFKNKKIIELFGDYWHNRKDAIKRDKRRLKAYKKYGYKVLVIWEHELKDLIKLKQRILTFNRRKNPCVE